MDIYREFTFEAAHMIPQLPEWHCCGRLHGHTYRVDIWLRGEIPAGRPWFKDWGEIDEPIAKILELVDHRYLNEVGGLEVPSCENLAVWMWKALVAFGGGGHLHKIKIYEGAKSGLEYYGPEKDEDWG